MKCSIPIQKNYFGVRHGKSSCDACTGRVKQAVTNLVKSEQAVVNSAQSFYSTCVEHLQKPMEASDKCQHYMLTFESHEKICKRPNNKNWQGIPDTRKLHQIGNTGGNVLYFCKFTCCCFSCLQGTIHCQNTICPSEREAFDLQKKKTVSANLKHWFGGEITNAWIHNIYNAQIHNIDWNAILQRLSEQRSFVQVKRYINGNPIPDLIICEPNDNLMPQETLNLDLVAMHYMPPDMPAGLAPVNIEGNGNCFPRTISYLLSKSQQLYTEMRVHIINKAVRNMDKYLDHNYVSVGAHNFYQQGTLPEQYAQYSDNYNPDATFNVVRLYKEELLDICKDGAFMGIWQIFQIANVIARPITSVHPNIGNPNVRSDLHRTVYCIDNAYNQHSPLHIMWTPMQVTAGQRPCHSVPLLKVVYIFICKTSVLCNVTHDQCIS